MSTLHQHDGYAPHSHEVRPDHAGVSRKPAAPYSDTVALDRIAALLAGGGHEFAEATLDEIAKIVRSTGRNRED